MIYNTSTFGGYPHVQLRERLYDLAMALTQHTSRERSDPETPATARLENLSTRLRWHLMKATDAHP